MSGVKVLFASFQKIDEEQRIVSGYASTEARDQQGEIVRLDAIRDALPGYLQWSNIREMHQPSAVGTAEGANVDQHGLWLDAKVVDDRAWSKVKAGVYKGFSIGGRVTKRDPHDRSVVTGIELTEISLVDRPANPDAKFELVKRAGDGILRYQPVQYWACSDANHQHLSKVEASECIQKNILDKSIILPDMMRGKNMAASSVANAAKKAADAVKDLASLVQNMENISKTDGTESDHLKEAEEAHRNGKENDDMANTAMAEAMEHSIRADASIADGKDDEAKHHESEAQTSETTAQYHAELADTFHDLTQHHLGEYLKDVVKVAKKSNGDDGDTGSDDDSEEHGGENSEGASQKAAASSEDIEKGKALAKSTVDHHNVMMENCNKGSEAYAALAKVAKDCKRDESADKREKFSKAMKAVSTKREAMGKAAGELLSLKDLKDMVGQSGGTEVENFHIDETQKVVPLAQLTKTSQGYVCGELNSTMTNLRWFGKREFSDDKRQEMADKGEAMSDGSFPIENKGDLKDAISAHGRAKDLDKAKEHIMARAKALGAMDELPDKWTEGNKVAKRAAKDVADMKKGMSLIGSLAGLLAQIDYLRECSMFEQIKEGDADDKTPKSLEDWLSQGAQLLREVVARETEELLSGADAEVPDIMGTPEPLAMVAKGFDWRTTVIGSLRESALDKALIVEKRVGLKSLAEKIEKSGARHSKSDLEKIQKIHDHTTDLGAACKMDDTKEALGKLAAAEGERDDAIKALDAFTKQISPLVKSTQEMGKALLGNTREVIELKARLKRVEEQPMPIGGRLGKGVFAIDREDDTGVGSSGHSSIDTVLGQLRQMPPGQHKQELIIKMAHLLRE